MKQEHDASKTKLQKGPVGAPTGTKPHPFCRILHVSVYTGLS
jgi:hypothetical protein